jgi:hypothetical protein
MEALLELEKVQRVLSFMSSRGLSDSGDGGAAADRFLAQFMLFLVRWSPPPVPASACVARMIFHCPLAEGSSYLGADVPFVLFG